MVRQLNNSHDWTFGLGKQNYIRGKSEVLQNIKTRLLSFKNDNPLNMTAGSDWFNIFSSKDNLDTILSNVESVILSTQNVRQIRNITINENRVKRYIEIKYEVVTDFDSSFTPQSLEFTI